MNKTDKIQLDADLVRRLITTQFPQWAKLPIKQVEPGGWDNRTFRLGEHMLVRLPSDEKYAEKVDKEHVGCLNWHRCYHYRSQLR